MKSQLKKLKNSSIKTQLGEVSLKENYRQDHSDYDQIYFRTSQPNAICKLYDLEDPASTERFHNEMEQYAHPTLTMLYPKVYCEEVKVKKVNYGLILFSKLDKQLNLKQSGYSLSLPEKYRLAIYLTELLMELKEQSKIYCNIRPVSIYKTGQKYSIIDAEFLRPEGCRLDMDSFILEKVENRWEYWAPEIIDPYSNQLFDYSLDIYSVGCILYQCITGKYPFDSKLSASSNIYAKLDKNQFLNVATEMYLEPSKKRRGINLKEVLGKLRGGNSWETPRIDRQRIQEQRYNMEDKSVRKGSGNGILDNISNVFSKMKNDSQGWFLNYVEDDEKAPNEKYLDSILTKMYKKQEKADKLSAIITKFVSNNSNRLCAIKKCLLLIGQAIRRGPEAALNSLLANINAIKVQYSNNQEIQSFASLLQKKVEVNEKFKKVLTGNFFLSEISNFKNMTIQDISSLMTYLQFTVTYLGNNKKNQENSELSKSLINFDCDEIYDVISTIILSVISIRKDNDLQLRSDNLKQLQPIEKSLNVLLRKISQLSNLINAHAIYSLEGEYIPYQQEIMLRTSPYYSTLQYFYMQCKYYKGLTVPTDYAQMFGSGNKDKDDKKVGFSNKDMKTSVMSANNGSQSGGGKNYFKEENNSDEDQDFHKWNKSTSHSSAKQQNNQKVLPYQIPSIKKISGKEQVSKSMFLEDQNSKVSTNKTMKNQSAVSFQDFINVHKVKAVTSPSKDFNDFLNFDVKKPPLPTKKQVKQPQLKIKKSTEELKKSHLADFDNIFEKKPQKNTAASPEINSNNLHALVNNGPLNFQAFKPFINQQQRVYFPPPEQIESPLVTKILQGLKLKPLKQLILKNKKIVLESSQIKVIKAIGAGSAGEVFYGKYKEQQVAIKRVKAKQNPNALKQFQRQLVTYIKIDTNPHLVSLVGLSESNGDFYLITEFCTYGSLFDLLHKKKLQIILSWKQRLIFALEIAQGMQFLHAMKPIIIHRDLKSLNVFVSKIGNTFKMKVADFGLSRSPEGEMMTTQLGTIHWMAPELLEGKQYSFKVDVYSYGILLWQILSRTTPYSNLQNPMAILKYVVIDKQRPNMQFIPKECPPQLITVMQRCWAHDPNDRPAFSEIIKLLKMINL